MLAVFSCFAVGAIGCGGSMKSAATTSTGMPTTVQVTINATAGSITQSVPMTVTLQ
jgi:hypothetical protein